MDGRNRALHGFDIFWIAASGSAYILSAMKLPKTYIPWIPIPPVMVNGEFVLMAGTSDNEP
jgi:hypothetical protein